MKSATAAIHALSFWFFVAIKVAGHSFADWSWWWLLLPQVPAFSLCVRALGL